MDVRPGGSHRHHNVLFRYALGENLGHLRRNGICIQIDKLHSQLAHQRIDQLLFGDKAAVLQNRTQTLSGVRLKRQRLVQLPLGNCAALDQQVAQLHILHGVVSPSSGVPPYGFRHRTINVLSPEISSVF